MDLHDYLRVLRRAWPVILAFVVVGTAVGVVLTVITPKTYQASAQIFVSVNTGTDSTTSQLGAGNTFTQDRVQTYTALAKSPDIANEVKRQLNLPQPAAEISDAISADAPQNRSLITLRVTDRDPSQAARIANAAAQVFNAYVVANESKIGNQPVVNLKTFLPATVPTTPVSPHKVINIGLGLVIGLFLGLALVLVRAVLDTTMKGAGDFEAVGVPVLGYVPHDRRATRTPIAFRGDPHSARSEAFRSIRTNMQFVDVDNPPRLIAVSSAMPGEGKSMTSINLAAALAEAGYRVCLVDADLRRPSIASTLGLVSEVGFTSVLIGETAVEDVLQNAGRNLAVLTSGPVPPNPSELLLSEHARSVIRRLTEQVDFVVVDTPPLLPVTDAAELATLVDAMVLVARFGKTTREQVERSVAALAKVGEKPVGVIVNMVAQSRASYDNRYGYYYTPYRPDRKRGDRKARDGDGAQVERDAAAVAAAVPDDTTAPSDDAVAAPAAGTTTAADAELVPVADGAHHRDEDTDAGSAGRDDLDAARGAR